MALRTTRKSYTPQALEAWFGRVVEPWEQAFAEEELRLGRLWYREGEVRALELTAEAATVYRKVRRDEFYAVVEPNGAPVPFKVRHSTTETMEGRALAVAGLYEIEELLADEISPAPPDDGPEPDTNGHHPDEKPAEPKKKLPPLPVTLRLNEQGLFAGIRPGKTKPDEALANAWREQSIRFFSRGRKCGFLPSARAKNTLVLRDPERMLTFFQEELPRWRDFFALTVDEEVERLAAGVQTVDVTARLDSKEEQLTVAWEARTGDQALDDKQRQRAFKSLDRPVFITGVGLVRVRGEHREVVRWWRRAKGMPSGERPLYLALSLYQRAPGQLKLSRPLAQWLKALSATPPTRDDLADFLRPYQRDGVAWMHHLTQHGCGALLADEMGLGKTLQVATLLAPEVSSAAPALIVCPASVVPVWQREWARWYPDVSVRLLRQGADPRDDKETAVWVASYTQLRRHRHLLPHVPFAYAVLDEAQMIKNPEAKVTQACFQIEARYRLALTGTPVENRVRDLWTIFRFLMPGLLGGNEAWDEAERDDTSEEARERLRKQVRPFLLRRTKAEVESDLPDKTQMVIPVALTPTQRRLYKDLVERGRTHFGDDLAAAARAQPLSLFTLLLRLRQACCDPALLPRVDAATHESGKLVVLGQQVARAVSSGRKVVVFSQFVSLLERAREHLTTNLPEVPLHWLTGQTADRAQPINAFQDGEGARVMLISLRAGGTGITLHAADTVILLDPWWNPAVEEQAIDRVHRIGQTHPVFVYRLITRGTVEERVEQLKSEKRALFSDLVPGGSEIAQLREHFAELSSLIGLDFDEAAEEEEESEGEHPSPPPVAADRRAAAKPSAPPSRRAAGTSRANPS